MKACLVTAIRGQLSARRSRILSAQQQAFASECGQEVQERKAGWSIEIEKKYKFM
jgi:hypothetical protein